MQYDPEQRLLEECQRQLVHLSDAESRHVVIACDVRSNMTNTWLGVGPR